jgi:uncharacterized protein YutD
MYKMFSVGVSLLFLNSSPEVYIDVSIQNPYDNAYTYGFSFPNVAKGQEFSVFISDSVHAYGKVVGDSGAIEFLLIDSIKRLSIKGQFTNSLDTLKDYVLDFNAETGTGHFFVIKEFKPLANGMWSYTFWDKNKVEQFEYYRGLPIYDADK